MNRLANTMVALAWILTANTSCAQTDSNTQENKEQVESSRVNDSSADVVEQRYGKQGTIKLPKSISFADIQSLLGTECDSDNQCKVIGVGSRPCGGPAHYLVYSDKATDEQELKKQVAVFNGLQKLDNAKKGMMGICQQLTAPKTYCAKKECVASVSGKPAEL